MALERRCVRQLRGAKAGAALYTDLLPLAERLPAYLVEGLSREAAFRAFLENRPHLFVHDDLGNVACAPGAWPAPLPPAPALLARLPFLRVGC